MALVIRLRQQGRKNRRSYRLVLSDKTFPRDGKYLENLEWYDPHETHGRLSLKVDRINYWVEKGAKLSEKARCLVKAVSKEK